MKSLVRDEVLQSADVIVVKVGTNILTTDDGVLNEERIARLTEDLSLMRRRGKRLVLVSSGAVGAGMGRLGMKDRPDELPKLQAVAAIGQGRLIATYERYFDRFETKSAQVLLTADDLSDRKRYLHVRNTFRALLDFGVIPIVNENDTVSVEELRTTFGDNDRLASLVAGLFESPLLILLTDVAGLYDRDPANPEAALVSMVEEWSADLMTMVAEKHSRRSKGGMASKLRAARMITEGNGNVIIAGGDKPETLRRIFDAQEEGTIFIVQDTRLSAWKRWIGFATRPDGVIVLDDGAVKAVLHHGKSLLPVGILNCSGDFERGDIVSLVDRNGREIARGLTNYNRKEVLLIRGQQSATIKELLDSCPYEEVVHQDNMQPT